MTGAASTAVSVSCWWRRKTSTRLAKERPPSGFRPWMRWDGWSRCGRAKGGGYAAGLLREQSGCRRPGWLAAALVTTAPPEGVGRRRRQPEGVGRLPLTAVAMVLVATCCCG